MGTLETSPSEEHSLESLTQEIRGFLAEHFPAEQTYVDWLYQTYQRQAGNNPSAQTLYLNERVSELRRDANMYGLGDPDKPLHYRPTLLAVLEKAQQELLKQDPDQPPVLSLGKILGILTAGTVADAKAEFGVLTTLTTNALGNPYESQGNNPDNSNQTPSRTSELREGIVALCQNMLPGINDSVQLAWQLNSYQARLAKLSGPETGGQQPS